MAGTTGNLRKLMVMVVAGLPKRYHKACVSITLHCAPNFGISEDRVEDNLLR